MALASGELFVSGLLTVGNHTISVVYNGNANHAGSTAAPVTHTVEKADTTTVLAPTTSPTLPGEAVTLTATVSVVAPGGGSLAGRVRFRAGNRFLGSADLSGNTATLTTSDIVTGDHVLTAEYAGNTRHNGSLSEGVAHSVDPRVGPEFRVNTETAGAQDLPAVAALNGGGFVVVWSSNGQDGSGRGIYAQRYDASGGVLDVENRVNTTTADQQSYPAIAPLVDGGYVVVWESRLQDGSGYGVFAQRYNSTGGTVGGEVQVNTTTVSIQNRPAVAGLSDGGFVVVWRSNLQDGSRYGIYAQRYDAGGAIFGTETQVNTTTAGNQLDPAVTALSNAGFMVVWTSVALDGTAEGVFAQRFDTLNAPSGSQIQVNTTPSTRFLEPDVTLLANGEVVVVWAALSSDNTSYNVDAQRFDANGSAVGGEFRVDTRRGGAQRQPVVTAVPGGGFIVTWASTRPGWLGLRRLCAAVRRQQRAARRRVPGQHNDSQPSMAAGDCRTVVDRDHRRVDLHRPGRLQWRHLRAEARGGGADACSRSAKFQWGSVTCCGVVQ